MLRGSIMAEFTDESRAELALVGLGDLVLLAAVEAERVRHDETLGEYVSGAAQRFARLASDEDWLGLMNSVEKSENPAASCLGTMVRWSVARDQAEAKLPEGPAHPGCSCGGGGGCHEQA
jgi:hypothetical protein